MQGWVDPNTHGWVANPESDADWEALLREYAGNYAGPLSQVLQVARSCGCQTVVVENRYVDADYRSDYSAFWSLRFRDTPAFARRLHFFEDRFSDDEVHDLPSDVGYIGYSVLRPISNGRVGRTVLRPPPDLQSATMAVMTDEVSLFGNSLKVEGIPFAQQDGEFLRCAHVAAWMCHYPAHRKRLVGRRPSAEIVELSPSMLSVERSLPSRGMTLNQLQAVFGALGKPALFYGLTNMPRVPGVEDPTPETDPAGEPLPPGYWDTRMLSVICRYLNSGVPVLVATEDHAFVLVGWYREGEDVRFIVCDDQVGPYEVIESPFIHYKAPWKSLMVPLPPKVFLSGEAAEIAAHRVLMAIGLGAASLRPLADGLQDGSIALRTTLREGSRFKSDIAAKASSDEVLRLLRLARLPHWVWVVEAHVREGCERGDPCVIAEAVFDSTSWDREPRLDVIALPGIVATYPPEGEGETAAAGAGPWASLLPVH